MRLKRKKNQKDVDKEEKSKRFSKRRKNQKDVEKEVKSKN